MHGWVGCDGLLCNHCQYHMMLVTYSHHNEVDMLKVHLLLKDDLCMQVLISILVLQCQKITLAHSVNHVTQTQVVADMLCFL